MYGMKSAAKKVNATEPNVRSHRLCSHSITSQHFIGPEGSLPCPQETPLVPTLGQLELKQFSILMLKHFYII
jgi:hypothetical protein